MVNYDAVALDNVFGALANQYRRRMVAMLSEKSLSISELASPLGLSLPAIHKHIKALEGARLVRRTKVGRSNEIALNAEALAEAEAWIEQHRAYWTKQFDALDAYVEELNERRAHGPSN